MKQILSSIVLFFSILGPTTVNAASSVTASKRAATPSVPSDFKIVDATTSTVTFSWNSNGGVTTTGFKLATTKGKKAPNCSSGKSLSTGTNTDTTKKLVTNQFYASSLCATNGNKLSPATSLVFVIKSSTSEPTLQVLDANGIVLWASPLQSSNPNLLKNSDFSLVVNKSPTSWTTGATLAQATSFTWSQQCGGGITNCVSMNSTSSNMAYYNQTVDVTPGLLYRLSGTMKGTNISNSGGIGAAIGVLGTWDNSRSDGSTGTFDWQTKDVFFIADSQAKANVSCGLGWYASDSTGQVSCANMSLKVATDYSILSGQHIKLYLEKRDLSTISQTTLTTWLSHLDQAYLSYQDLVGAAPFSGERMNILSVPYYPGGWAVAAQTIRWERLYVQPELADIEVHPNNWSFGITHEISHNFDLDSRWVWEGEFWANFKMYYVILQNNGMVKAGSAYYTGAELKNFYFGQGDQNNLNWDYITYRFITISEQIGWNAFKQTFRFFNAMAASDVPSSRQGKFDLFISKLSSYSGVDVLSLFTANERAWIQAQLAQ